MAVNVSSLLRNHGLRDTQSRRLVLGALAATNAPVTNKDIFAWIKRHDSAISLVTVYRVLEKFIGLGIVHHHPSSGGVTLCTLAGHHGHHGFLSCRKCGKVEEFSDGRLCKEEDRVAAKAGFVPEHHVSDIVGTCSSCHSSSPV